MMGDNNTSCFICFADLNVNGSGEFRKTLTVADKDNVKELVSVFCHYMKITSNVCDKLRSSNVVDSLRACEACEDMLTRVNKLHYEVQMISSQIDKLMNGVATRVLSNKEQCKILAISSPNSDRWALGSAIVERFSPIVIASQTTSSEPSRKPALSAHAIQEDDEITENIVIEVSTPDHIKTENWEDDFDEMDVDGDDLDFSPSSDSYSESGEEYSPTTHPSSRSAASVRKLKTDRPKTRRSSEGGGRGQRRYEEKGNTCDKTDPLNLIIKCKRCEFSRRRSRHWRLVFTNHFKKEHDLNGKAVGPNYIPDVDILHEGELVFMKTEDGLVCIKCNSRPIVRPDRLKDHMGNHGVKPHVCEVCNKGFAQPVQLRRHLYVHSEQKQFVCDMCGASYKHVNTLINHRKTEHDSSASQKQEEDDPCNQTNAVNLIIRCKLCEYSRKRTRQWRLMFTNHLKNNHDLLGVEPNYIPDVDILHEGKLAFIKLGERLVCVKCNNRPVKPDKLKHHMDRHGDNIPKPKPHVCEVCNKGFAEQRQLRLHSYVHSEQKQFVCDACGESFKHYNSLSTHRKTMHDPSTSKNVVCEICGKKFWIPSYLKEHMASHTEDRPIQCDICGASFKAKSGLFNHTKRLHGSEDDPVFTCDQCGKQFKQEIDLRSHSRVHATVKPFECQLCQKQFARGIAWRNHMRNHDESSKLPCPHCSVRFTSGSSLHTHIRKFHGADLSN